MFVMKEYNFIKFIFCITFCLSVFINSAHAAVVVPAYTSSVPKNVYGFLQADKKIDIYEQPTTKSNLIETAKWDENQVYFANHKSEPNDVFAVFVPNRKYVFFYVTDETDGWCKILYDKNESKSGWVKPNKPEDFWGLKDFYSHYGKKNSLYYLRDVDVRTRSLRSGPSEEAQALQGFSITKNIKLAIIRGNWALVSIIDFEGTVPKTGFIKWRDADGKLLLFPQMD